jgi:hypothetical protein
MGCWNGLRICVASMANYLESANVEGREDWCWRGHEFRLPVSFTCFSPLKTSSLTVWSAGIIAIVKAIFIVQLADEDFSCTYCHTVLDP